jgi:AcrR family transcriptional regulator
MARDATPETTQPDDLRERLVVAGLLVLDRHGPAELTVRRIAEVAGSSTMGVYTKFESRAGILEAIYRRGFQLLRAALAAVPEDQDPVRRILDLSLAYRRFALANVALYAFMFERPVPDFDPGPALRREALETTFSTLVGAVREAAARGALPEGDPVPTSYLLWGLLHGIVSIELTHAARSPLPGWFLDTPEKGERILLDGLRAMVRGVRGAQERGQNPSGGRPRTAER